MTGRRPSRGGAGDPWRGGRPARPDGAGPGDVELEELPVQAVRRRRRQARVTTSAALAAVALVALLAVGFGVLGGRPEVAAPRASPGGPSGIAS